MTPREALRRDFTDRCSQLSHAIATGDLDRALVLKAAIDRLLDLATMLPAHPVSAAAIGERQQEAG